MMNIKKRRLIAWRPLVCLVTLVSLATLRPMGLRAQNVSMGISSTDAYVGMPIILQFQISNAQDYLPPKVPKIDGCEVTAAGTPSQSSQIMIINGRRSESRSVTIQYLITPRRAGTFEIPVMELKVDGKVRKTKPLSFTATKSETGDLMFVEIEGASDTVYVGEPLELKLKIWLKPFQDEERRVKLSEGHMWQSIAEQTSWGSFRERLQELAQNNQRPSGREVSRDNGSGEQVTYYLYEVITTVYPDRPGEIDASDVQVVVNYPVSLGASRGFFPNGSVFQQMDDEFFAPTRSGRLTVTSTRPIVAEAEVDATEVISIPTKNRPADYRGAVGRYRIFAEAEPRSVSAGDPITLRLGIVGDGPLDRLQAPPLADIGELTADFKVTDQSLAGFVTEGAKVFVTTIRPRREGITEIPPIPFSYFDPETDSFGTAFTKAIPITVKPADMLSLDSIVSNSGAPGAEADADVVAVVLAPQLENEFSKDLLAARRAGGSRWLWWSCVVVPPLIWMAIVLLNLFRRWQRYLPSFRSAKSRCLIAIDRATSRGGLVTAFVRYIELRTKATVASPTQAVGTLRTATSADLRSAANEVEAFLDRLGRGITDDANEVQLVTEKEACIALVEKLESLFGSSQNRRVRGKRRAAGITASRKSAVDRGSQAIGLLCLLAGTACGGTSLSTPQRSGPQPIGEQLTETQLESIFADANDLYRRAQQIAPNDQAEARTLFAESVRKYQLLVDAEIEESRLFVNLGNALLQSGELGRAIANYHRALRIEPSNRQAQLNLRFAESKAREQQATNSASRIGEDPQSESISLMGNAFSYLSYWNKELSARLGGRSIQWGTACASLAFWALMISRGVGYRLAIHRFAIIPLVVLLFGAASLGLESQRSQKLVAVVVSNLIELRDGDGEEFDVTHRIETAEGTAVRIEMQRGTWLKIETDSGAKGWLRAADVEQI
jgi:tetratricopeptide (TPR) repeat protein